MNLNQLYYFKKLTEVKHFTKAAQELHISQPSFSYSISALEEELGTCLFQRNGRHISLTENGEEFLKYTNSCLSELERGIEVVKKNENLQTGKVDIGYIPTIAANFMPKLIKDYIETFNYETKFNLYSCYTSEVIEGIKSGRFDIGFCSFVENEADLVFFPVSTQKIVIIVPQGHELSENKKLTLDEISEYPLITYNSHSNSLGILLKNVFDSHKIRPNIVYELNDETSIGGFVSEGFGVGVVANVPLLMQFNLNIIPLDINLRTRVVYCVFNKKIYHTKAIEAFLEFVSKKQISLY